MNKNRNFAFRKRVSQKMDDGVIVVLPIDQFPVQDFNINRFGFPKSDITIMDELSRTNSVNLDLYNAFASRINVLKAEPANNKSVDELIREFKPAWIQTVTEEMDFVNWYHNQFDDSMTITDDDVDKKSLDTHEVSDASSSTES